jgi:Lrp/AsnC family transcriptional regulator, leucine-responsive regulatory protein
VFDTIFADVYSGTGKFCRMIDVVDIQILSILQDDGRISNAEIARQIGLAPSAVLERIRKLEDRQIIKGYFTRVDPRHLGLALTVFVSVRTSECGGGVEEALSGIPEVLEVHDVAGEDCYLIKVRTKDTEALGRLLRERIKLIPKVIGTRTTVVLQTYKETTTVPLTINENPDVPDTRRKTRVV